MGESVEDPRLVHTQVSDGLSLTQRKATQTDSHVATGLVAQDCELNRNSAASFDRVGTRRREGKKPKKAKRAKLKLPSYKMKNRVGALRTKRKRILKTAT